MATKALTPAEQFELFEIDKALRESPPETPEDQKRREALERRYLALTKRLSAS